MHIVHLSSVHPRDDTRIFFKQCRSLAAAGHEVSLVVADEFPDELKDGVKIISVGAPRNRGLRISSTARKVVRVASEMSADLYHCHDPELLLSANCNLVHKAPTVYDMHENLPLSIKDKGWIPKFARPVLSSVVAIAERGLLRNVAVVFAEESYRKHYPHAFPAIDVRNYPIVADLPRASNLNGGLFTLGYVGGVTELRGVFIVLDAIRVLKDAGVEVGFKCVGPISADVRERAERFCIRHGLDHVRFYGRQFPTDAWATIASVHAGVVVIKEIGNYVQSLPTKLLEYMGMGLPVIASNFKLYREVVESSKCGITVNPEDSLDLARAILYLRDNAAEARAMGSRGREKVTAEYNWACEADRLLKLYYSLND